MSDKKPKPPIISAPPRKVCPICGKPSYSAVGVHPQCAQKIAKSTSTRL